MSFVNIAVSIAASNILAVSIIVKRNDLYWHFCIF